jgi:hypothetical protein
MTGGKAGYDRMTGGGGPIPHTKGVGSGHIVI